MDTKENETSVIYENRSNIRVMQGDINYIKEGIAKMNEGFDKLSADIRVQIGELHTLLDNKYVSKDELTIKINSLVSRIEDVEREVKSISGDRRWVVLMIVGAVISGLVGLVVINPLNI